MIVYNEPNGGLSMFYTQMINKALILAYDHNCFTFASHDDSDDDITYVQPIKSNELARVLKLADLKHNSDISIGNHR